MNFAKCQKLLITAGAAVMLISFTELSLFAEAVFLTNGSIVEGTIISDGAGSVTVRTADKKTRQIKRDEIMRILYTELKLGKIYVQKRDGKGIVAHLVDEDRESYTFRKELYNPEEFTLKRNEVLFMAEKNPSGLQPDGEIGTDRVSLKWLPPYDPVKKYKLFAKKKQSDKYEPVDSTGSTSITIRNLSSNTEYFIIVTAIDSAGNESEPSNELKFRTKNIKPDEPEIISSGDVRADERAILWKAATDPDGKVEKYRIYGIKDSRREMLAEVKKTDYTLKASFSYNKVDIVSVDDKGDESDATSVPFYGSTVVGFHPGIIYPMGRFSEMFSMGYGGMFSISERDLFLNNFEGVISIGFYSLKGKDLIEEKNKEYKDLMFVPFYLNAAFCMDITGNFSIKPFVSMGFALLDVNYIDRNKTVAEGREEELNLFEPACTGGLSMEYRITSALSVSAECGYGAVVEKSGLLSFISANAGIAYSF